MLPLRVVNEEVVYGDAPVIAVDRGMVEGLKERARSTRRRRVRLCSHEDVGDTVHEMLIVHERDAYVRPHKHLGKPESFHVIEGVVDVVFFDDQGAIHDVLCMGDFASGLTFYYRLNESRFHTLLIRSDVLVFHEVTRGPFVREETVFASWSPPEGSGVLRERFLEDLVRQVEDHKQARKEPAPGGRPV